MEVITRREAIERGLKWYFTGEPCKWGHIEKRQVSNGSCLDCASRRLAEWRQVNVEKEKVRAKEYRESNAEKIKTRRKELRAENLDKERMRCRKYRAENLDKERMRSKAWKKDNPEKVKAQEKQYYADNPEKIRVWNRKYRERNPETYDARVKEYRSKNPEKVKEWHRKWAKNNPERRKANLAARRARKHQAPGTHSAADIKRILLRQGKRCVYCKASLADGYHVDHIIPLAKGGGNGPENLQCLCPTCNLSKGDKLPAVFAQSIGMLL